jgi:lipopolysaccharide transport system ATP-binding protein
MPPAIELRGVGKRYRVHRSRRDALLDALGLGDWLERRGRAQEFWALRGIDLEVGQGERVGIIGRNGAGKSTLLRLITGNVAPAEGVVTVRGSVQALMDAGGGFHPEFTGRENAQAALTYNGLTTEQARDAIEEIADFTELGAFMDQPLKTYSSGMQARLAFAVATTISPEILIVDEILGTGDAYFFAKSTERMRQLVEGGASVLLVSHALDQIVRFCDQAVWIDRGHVVMRGPSLEVVKRYEKFTRDLERRRVQANNARSGKDGFRRDTFADVLTVHLRASGTVDVAEVALLRDGELEEAVRVGDAQDTATALPAHVLLDGGAWGPPRADADGYHRPLHGTAVASISLWLLLPGARYEVAVRFRAPADATLGVEVHRNGKLEAAGEARGDADGWTTYRLPLSASGEPGQERDDDPTISRWTEDGALTIEQVTIVDEDGEEQAVFRAFQPLAIHVRAVARAPGRFPVIPVAIVIRDDGVILTRHIGETVELELEHGDRFDAVLDLGRQMLGNGRYFVTVALYGRLDPHSLDSSHVYEVLDRSFEFQVTGHPPPHNEAVRHPGAWSVERVRDAVG